MNARDYYESLFTSTLRAMEFENEVLDRVDTDPESLPVLAHKVLAGYSLTDDEQDDYYLWLADQLPIRTVI